jgi:hypothetical protein
MLNKFLLFAGSFTLAFLILIISIFRIAEVKYVFSQAPSPTPLNSPKPVSIDYNLPDPGSISPDSIFWPLEALRDRIWLTFTINPSKKADIYLLLADKRLGDAKLLFEKENPDLGISVLTKAEKYLELAMKEEEVAQKQGNNTTDFLKRYSMATLKHREVLEELMADAPEDARPLIVKMENYPKTLFNSARDGLLEAGATVPQNPFN